MTKELNVGVIGLGKMGLLHASILNRIPHVSVKAICESKLLLTRYSKRAFPQIAVVKRIADLSAFHLDVAVVTTPIPTHSAVIKALYEADIRNLFVEKTLAENAAESQAICRLAREMGGVNMVGYMARYAVTFLKVKELLGADLIGGITSFKAYAYSSDFIGIPEKSYLRGGTIRDLGCHIIDLAQWYFGGLEILDASVSPREPVNGESDASFRAASKGRFTGEFDISWRKEGYRVPDYGLGITGTKGKIEVNNDMVSLKNGSGDKTWHRIDLNDNAPFLLGAAEYYREDAAFIEAVMNGTPASPDFETAAKVDDFIDRVKSQARPGAS